MKKKLFSLIAICFVVISIFTMSGCAITLKGGPASTDVVSGNGSLSVRKGDYLYFVNGYVSSSSLAGDDNDYGEARNGAIYRAKLNNGKLIYDISEDEDGEEVKTLKNVELLVPKIAGFEFTSLYIFDNTLYFTSPNTEKDNTGTIRFDLTDVFAVSINGGDPKKLANAINLTSKDNLTLTQVGKNVYLTYLTNSTLYNVKISGKESKKTTKVDGVSAFVTSNVVSEQNFVYYNRSIKEGENAITGNVLAKLDVTTGEETILSKDNVNTYSVKAVKNGKLYYTRSNSLITNAYIYSKNIEDFSISEETQYTVVAYSSTQYILDLGEGYVNGVLVNENDKLMLLTGINNPETDIVDLYTGTFTFLGNYGEFVYGKDANGNLIRINIQTKVQETLVESTTSMKLDMNSNFDYENGYIYYYVEYTGEDGSVGYYLNRTYINQEDKESELVGKMLEKHISKE